MIILENSFAYNNLFVNSKSETEVISFPYMGQTDIENLKSSNEKSEDSREDNSEKEEEHIAVSLTLSNEIRAVARNVRSADLSNGKKMSTSDLLKRCTALSAKIGDERISAGENTYIQSELDRIKREMSHLDIAL